MYNLDTIKIIMVKKNIRQVDLLNLISIKTGKTLNKASLSYILANKRIATPEQQELICRALDLSFNTNNNFIRLTKQSRPDHRLLRDSIQQSMKYGIKITPNFAGVIDSINSNANLTQAQKNRRISSLTTFYKLRDINDLVHPTLSVASTNRINYVRPNLIGGIPKDLLSKVILPRKPNTTLFSIDCKQQEPLLLINILDISEIKLLLQTENDVYSAIYRVVYGAPPSEVQRKLIKQMWNALAYGASKYTLIEIAKANNIYIDVDKIHSYFYSIPEYKSFFSGAKTQAKTGNREVVTYFNTYLRTDAPAKSLVSSLANHRIQGTGVDILAFMVEKANILAPGLITPYYTRHDEIILEVNNSIVNANTINYLDSHFTQQIDDWLPFRVSTSPL